MQYTVDVIPLAVATGNIRAKNHDRRGHSHDFQAQFNLWPRRHAARSAARFRNSSHVKPFIHVNGGLLGFNDPPPLPDSGRLALVGEAGAGLRVFTSERRAVTFGVRFHHISNGDRSGSNRGLNQFIFYAGFSVFK